MSGVQRAARFTFNKPSDHTKQLSVPVRPSHTNELPNGSSRMSYDSRTCVQALKALSESAVW